MLRARRRGNGCGAGQRVMWRAPSSRNCGSFPARHFRPSGPRFGAIARNDAHHLANGSARHLQPPVSHQGPQAARFPLPLRRFGAVLQRAGAARLRQKSQTQGRLPVANGQSRRSFDNSVRDRCAHLWSAASGLSTPFTPNAAQAAQIRAGSKGASGGKVRAWAGSAMAR